MNMYVCLSVCPRESLCPELHSQSLPNFRACYASPWLGPPLMALRYVMYFRFMDDVILDGDKLRGYNAYTPST